MKNAGLYFCLGLVVSATLSTAQAGPRFVDVTEECDIHFLGSYGPPFDSVTNAADQFLQREMGNGAAVGDYDSDGWLDLFIGNESDSKETHPCELYHNNGDGTFTDVASQVGVAHIGMVKGVVWGDIDNDGRLDLYLSCFEEANVLYQNEGETAAPDGSRRQTRSSASRLRAVGTA